MRADEYQRFADRSRQGYIDDMVEHGGMLRSAAEAKAARDFALVLPDGLETPATGSSWSRPTDWRWACCGSPSG
jgi:hypothetical protein